MKRIIKWMATDGLLHFLVCAVISLAVLYITDIIWLAVTAAAIPALAKEYHDVFVQKDNTWEQAAHDLICDFAGIAFTMSALIVKSLIF